MKPRFLLFLLVWLAFAVGAAAQSGGALYTHSFSNRADWGTHPQTVTYSHGTMTIDLSSIQGANVVRAVFYPHLEKYNNTDPSPWPYLDRNVQAAVFNVFDAAGNPIPPRGPRFLSVDLTAQVRAAVAAGRLSLRLQHIGWPQYALTLSVTCNRALPAAMPAVTGVAAVCRHGDTMVTFTEIDSPVTSPTPDWANFRTILDSLDATAEVRYRIYRSTTPLTTPADLADAELVDEIRSLSCWDFFYYGIGGPRDDDGTTVVPLLPVADLTLAAPGTGIYVHRYRGTAPATAYYFVSRMVNGQEDLSTLAVGTNATAAVAESAGLGMVLERVRVEDTTFYSVAHATKHYYVRWEAPPYCNLPSMPFDYLVCEPPPAARVSPAPVSLGLHGWGGCLNRGFYAWYDAAKGALHVSTNQYPYDWWTAYNENLGTIKPFPVGTVQPFNQARLLSFLDDFVDSRFPIDRHKLLLHGTSMGGSGASMWGMRSGHIFSGIISAVGVHAPAESPHFISSFDDVYGAPAQACRYDNTILQRFGYPLVTAADNVNVWDYWDTPQWLIDHLSVETPWITFSNSPTDADIGWPQAWDMVQALRTTQRGFNFIWDQRGHGARPEQLGGFAGGSSTLQFHFAQFVPVASNCSLDGDLGTAPETTAPEGQINQYLTWDTTTVVDTAASLSFRLAITRATTATSATADITPRRRQGFRPAAGSWCRWQATDSTGLPLGSGTVQVGPDGLFTLPGIAIPRLTNFANIVVVPVQPPASTYTTWRAANWVGTDLTNDAISGPDADPDGAGLTNFARYAFALPARGPVASPVTLGSAIAGTDTFLTLTFPRRTTASDLSYVLESSTDLVTWTAVPDRTYTAGSDSITAQDAVAMGTAARRFLRLCITTP